MSQTKYIENSLKKFGFDKTKPANTQWCRVKLTTGREKTEKIVSPQQYNLTIDCTEKQ